jgi:hypothetical protein
VVSVDLEIAPLNLELPSVPSAAAQQGSTALTSSPTYKDLQRQAQVWCPLGVCCCCPST